MISIEDVRQRVADIDDSSDDGEIAHRKEDRLFCDVLKAIADGAPEPAELARAALESRNLDFDRYYSFADA